jgi:hypothetical protein
MVRIKPLATASGAKAHSASATQVQSAMPRGPLIAFRRMGATPTHRFDRHESAAGTVGSMVAGSRTMAPDSRDQVEACGRCSVSRWRMILRHSRAPEWSRRAIVGAAPASLRLAIQRPQTPAAVRSDRADPRGPPLRTANRAQFPGRANHTRRHPWGAPTTNRGSLDPSERLRGGALPMHDAETRPYALGSSSRATRRASHHARYARGWLT